MPHLQKSNFIKNVTWKQPVVFAVATALCTILAIWAVVLAPVSPVPGVSGLYIAAAVYVPLALWFGVWGCVAGYVSCLFMGLYLGYSLEFVLVWSLADFFEGFVPLLIYRFAKVKLVSAKKYPKITYGLMALLVSDFILSSIAIMARLTDIFIGTFVVGIFVLVAQVFIEDRKTWITWLVVGIFGASFVSGFFGVVTLVSFDKIPIEVFSTVLFGWIFGDIIVLSTIGTILTVLLTPHIEKTRAYVRGFFY